MFARHAELFQCLAMRARSIPLVSRQTVPRQLCVQLDHHLITRHLGENRRARNRKRNLIAANDGGSAELQARAVSLRR